MSSGARQFVDSDKLKALNGLALLYHAALGMIRAQKPLNEILEKLCIETERQYPGLLCSILLLDPDGVTVRHGAAPSLAKEYIAAIDGASIGPFVGSCGTALYRQERVIVADIATDPLWANYRHLVEPYGLRACWSSPIASEDGTPLGTFAIYYREARYPDQEHLELISHITHLAGIAMEQERSKAELRAAEARYRTLVERLPAITYVADLGSAGKWHYVSPQIESILGFSPEEWLADPNIWVNNLHPDDREAALAAEELFSETQQMLKSEYRFFARDGRTLWFHDEAVILRQAEGSPPMMQGLMYDITEEKQLEEQLRQAQKMEAVGQLAGGVAHDFNNLLMLIQLHTDRLCDTLPIDHEARKDTVAIEAAVSRASSLTKQLLAFSRKQVLKPRVLDLNSVLAEAASMLRRLITQEIELKFVPGEALGRIKADPDQIVQVALNLAVNSRDAMPQGGTLTFETKNVTVTERDSRGIREATPGNYVALIVRDTGSGMDEQTQARIFEPFFTTKEPGKGTGLGLATVYGIVRQSGGWIEVESRPNAGTTFKVNLRRVEDPLPAVINPVQQPDVSRGSETILVVEDLEGLREMTTEFLQQSGYHVLSATNGTQALQVASEYLDSIHLLLTDLLMPTMGGHELARRLLGVRPKIKVIFMSGYPEEPGFLNDTIAPARPILQKPFSLEALARRIRETLDEAEEQ